jgi:ADP-ribose pyrophosphatase YjhB (NUDIX family)
MITCTFEKGYVHHLRHAVVHALVVKDNMVLLGKRAADIPEGGKWNIPGGFMERDETAMQATLRELKEETGWEGKIISLFHINTRPDRVHEDRQNVILEFLVEPLRQTTHPDWETPEIAWVPVDQLRPWEEYAFDHGQSLKLLTKYLKQPFPLPILE